MIIVIIEIIIIMIIIIVIIIIIIININYHHRHNNNYNTTKLNCVHTKSNADSMEPKLHGSAFKQFVLALVLQHEFGTRSHVFMHMTISQES